MKLQQKINIEEVAKLTLRNILSSKGIIYKHYENKIKKKPFCKDFDKSILQITNNQTQKG
jgi:hypothetical protein